MKLSIRTALAVAAIVAGGVQALAAEGCDGKLPAGTTNLKVSFHNNVAQAKVMTALVDEFNASQSGIKVTLQVVDGLANSYDNFVTGAAAANDLPGILDADAAKALNYAWSGYIQPLDSCIPADLRAELPATLLAEGQWQGKQWAIPLVDSGVALYLNKKVLTGLGIRIPTGFDDVWTVKEFDDILVKLRAAGYEHPLDMNKQRVKGEFYPYAFLPVVWSAGGDLINRTGTPTSSAGNLDKPEVIEALTHFQKWYREGYVDDNSDEAAFPKNRSPISWSGLWSYLPYKKAIGDDLVVVPLPKFGAKTAGAQGGWQFTINKNIDADVAWKFIAFCLTVENNKRFAAATAAPPLRKALIETSDLYGPKGDLHVVTDYVHLGLSKPRPPHPGYVVMSNAFAQAIQDIMDGRDVKAAVTGAAKAIDDDLVANEGYPLTK
jgi:multiple sugar transport system substrate-binding protein